MSKLPISKGYRKYLRLKKAKIRQQTFDLVEQERLIKELYRDILSKDKIVNTNKITNNQETNIK